jgi:hypothetical protein
VWPVRPSQACTPFHSIGYARHVETIAWRCAFRLYARRAALEDEEWEDELDELGVNMHDDPTHPLPGDTTIAMLSTSLSSQNAWEILITLPGSYHQVLNAGKLCRPLPTILRTRHYGRMTWSG